MVRRWDGDAAETLQGCFQCTDWDVFTDGSSLEEATEVVTHHITFCEEMIVPTKTVKVFSNNKPWITKALKKTLNKKKIAFNSENRIKSKLIQNRLNKEIKAAKRGYKEKVEKLFQEGKARVAWQGVKTLTGLPNKSASLETRNPVNMAENLNQFHCRFDQSDLSQDRKEQIAELIPMTSSQANLELQQAEVELMLKRMRPNKAPGPDQICGRPLKSCCSQLAGVFCYLFKQITQHLQKKG